MRGYGVKRIFVDTDLGSDCDDGGALALLHALAGLGLCDIIGIAFLVKAVRRLLTLLTVITEGRIYPSALYKWADIPQIQSIRLRM